MENTQKALKLKTSKATLSLTKGVKGECSLLKLPKFDPIWSISIDYMHNICLGVVKAMIGIWYEEHIIRPIW